MAGRGAFKKPKGPLQVEGHKITGITPCARLPPARQAPPSRVILNSRLLKLAGSAALATSIVVGAHKFYKSYSHRENVPVVRKLNGKQALSSPAFGSKGTNTSQAVLAGEELAEHNKSKAGGSERSYWHPSQEFTENTSIAWDGSGADIVLQVLCEELNRRESPAAPFAEAFVRRGMKYGVHPYFLLSIFRMESNWGKKGIGAKNRSVGNIRFTEKRPDGIYYDNNGGYRRYPDWGHGVHDLARLLESNYLSQGLSTPNQIIPRYAPSSENDVRQYVDVVTNYMRELAKRHEEIRTKK